MDQELHRRGRPLRLPIALTGGPTTFASVALEPSVVESIEWTVIDRLVADHMAWLRAVCLGLRRLAELKVQRERDLLMLMPEQLDRQFLAERP